jgi:hypothetical protein
MRGTITLSTCLLLLLGILMVLSVEANTGQRPPCMDVAGLQTAIHGAIPAALASGLRPESRRLPHAEHKWVHPEPDKPPVIILTSSDKRVRRACSAGPWHWPPRAGTYPT